MANCLLPSPSPLPSPLTIPDDAITSRDNDSMASDDLPNATHDHNMVHVSIFHPPTTQRMKARLRHTWEYPGRGGRVMRLDLMALNNEVQNANVQSNGSTNDDEARPIMLVDRNNECTPLIAQSVAHKRSAKRHQARTEKLSEWAATSISGNDITASVLYCAGLTVITAGIYAPICMIAVSIMLYMFRSIYAEAIGALQQNGGAYSVLLNSTSKSTAAIAACLTVLSYVATAVVSATTAVQYATHLIDHLPIDFCVFALLALFALVSLIGISESASVALAIFVCHITIMSTLVVVVVFNFVVNGLPIVGGTNVTILEHNINSPLQPIFAQSLIYGFSAAALGISGFETSSNFVEEQADGVFPKTLRNMWALTTIFNPVLCTLAIFTMTLERCFISSNSLLAHMALIVGGPILESIVSADACLVLAGSILTSYVGVIGLCRRLAMDRCLPAALLATNRFRGTNHVIILGFFALNISIYTLLSGDVYDLANVYSISFLMVMMLFAFGNLLLKYNRRSLHRAVRSTWSGNIIALLLTLVAIFGTLSQDPAVLYVWLLYMLSTSSVMIAMFWRIPILRLLYSAMRGIFESLGFEDAAVVQWLSQLVQDIQAHKIAFFTKSGDLSEINKAVYYVQTNEETNHIIVVHLYREEYDIPVRIQENVSIIDEIYPKLRIDLLLVHGTLSPEVIDEISTAHSIPKNLMFLLVQTRFFNIVWANSVVFV